MPNEKFVITSVTDNKSNDKSRRLIRLCIDLYIQGATLMTLHWGHPGNDEY